MSVFIIHLSWFVLFSTLCLFFFLLSLWLTLTFSTLSVSLDLFSSWFINLNLSVSLDLFSSWFSFVVTLISSVIIVYSYFYMSPYSKPNYFIWLTVFFVLSMLFVINMSNFFFIMLGWDGLGLVSFFLIVYYQNFSSISSGLFTVLMNRIGDCFFIVSISIMFLFYSDMWSSNDMSFFWLILCMLVTFMTNSAIFPFSPWLPIAMAAPTPISALVHSSTLVTAGLFLSMRFSFLFYSNYTIITLFMVLSVFTSFYAGMNAVFETDINNLIALSTLSHLGFIGLSFSSGLLFLSFFHLLVHALFNSALFMAIGDIMTNLFHSQDIRFLSSGYYYTTSSFYTIVLSLLNLLGLPTISGYFSNDFVLETLNFSYTSQFIVFIVFFNVMFTYYYTYQLFYFSFSSIKFSPYTMLHPSSMLHTICLLFLSSLGIFFGSIWILVVNPFIIHVSVPLVWKLMPYFINLFVLSYLLINLKLFKSNHSNTSFYFSNMMFLSSFIITLSSFAFLNMSFSASKTSEYGLYNYFVNSSVSSALSFMSLVSYKLVSLPILAMLLSFFLIMFAFFII